MSEKASQINVCLHKLADKDYAAIVRVIEFSASQGKAYSLSENISGADIIFTPEHIVPASTKATIITIVENKAEPSDVLSLSPPLLVSRVMRVLDAAAQPISSYEREEPNRDEKAAEDAQSESGQDESRVEPEVIERASLDAEVTEVIEVIEVAEKEDAEVDIENDSNEESVTNNVEQESERIQPVDDSTAVDINIDSDLKVEEQLVLDQALVKDVANKKSSYIALVVDDSAAIRKQLELELRAASIASDFAEDGEQALKMSEAKQYDLIFLDIVMPGIDGYDVCKEMRARESMKKTPIIMLSGKTSPLDEVQGVIAGASTYLTKPIKHEMFQSTLNRISNWLSDFKQPTVKL